MRWVRHGDPNYTTRRTYVDRAYKAKVQFDTCLDEVMKIELTKGYVSLVDREDFLRVAKFSWAANVNKQYNQVRACRTEQNKMIYLQHEVLNKMPWILSAQGLEIDHIDRNPLNNCKYNLRVTTHAVNMQNSFQALNRVGVCFNARANLWLAYLDRNGEKRKYLGYRKTKEEAETLLAKARENG
jgi:hypothetical protein